MTSSDRFPVPVRSAVKSNLTDWCFQNLSKLLKNCLALWISDFSEPTKLVSEHGRHLRRSSSYRTLAVPRTRTTLADRSFAVAGPRVWEQFTGYSLRQITSYGQFRQRLKTHLFTA